MSECQRNARSPARSDAATYRQSLRAAGGTAADQHVAGDPAAAGRGKGQHGNAEDVELAPDARGCAGEREDERSNEIQGQQQRVHPGLRGITA